VSVQIRQGGSGAKLGRLLIDGGLLSEERFAEAQRMGRETSTPLPDVLVKNRFVSERDLMPVLADQYGLEFVSLRTMFIDPLATKSISAKFACHYRIMPIDLTDGVIKVALSDPLDMSAVEDIETTMGYRVTRALACRSDIAEAVRRHYGVGADTVERILDELPAEVEAPDSLEESHDLENMAEDASVVRLVNQILQQAIEDRTTDIHFEVHREGMVARRRIDGVLYDTNVPSNIRVLYPAIVSRVKLMSGLNIVERRMPQDGRARVRIGGKNYDLRISVVPALHGEDVVIRILPTSMLFSLEKLGLAGAHLETIEGLIAEPHGILFVTGPTGSGKSTTLYACLKQLNTRDRKIITIEDPIEYELPGITQSQINTKIELSFARMLRSMLRHDPDIMMVGEVRDRETADIAIQTAMTGHLVMSTLHTNDAASGAVRLIDMGVDPYLITSTVRAFIAQRLVRTICESCKETYESDGATLYRGAGCRECHQAGYQGRVAICEILVVDDVIQDMIHRKASSLEIKATAIERGMTTLAEDGQDKIQRGVTSLEEVLRVTRT
jgi:type II secretory ATPase GspE/PulE/Tfp pilus assembly ATPase PilB-like protein